jgi:NDP-sugar pyrophosphorylase family protein
MAINKTSKTTSEIDVLILCGGYGSRLQPLISDRPKGMALIGGRPFLDILVDELLRYGFRRIIFCVGHLKEQIIDHFKSRNDADFLFSEETVPLGTGGAVENALSIVGSQSLLILNGDSFCQVNYSELVQFHTSKKSTATFVLTDPKERDDGGIVIIDKRSKVQLFLEKVKNEQTCNGFINAGIYLLRSDSIKFKKINLPFSLEYDFFPALTKSKPCYGFVINSQLVDIGTPKRYFKAKNGLIYNT